MAHTTAAFLDGLNDKQKEAVLEKNGAILVLAGAGSGKTKVLTSRIAQLVKSGVSAGEILAVTFTNKAAREMQERLSNYLGENVVRRMWVGTFHSICGRILRHDLKNYKTKDGRFWDNNYVIYDETDTKTVIKNILKNLNLDEKVYDYKSIKTTISNAKNKMQDAFTFASLARDYYNQKVSDIYYEYERILAANNALDFDDMLMLAVNMLKTNEETRKKYETQFKHILVDEFQDTNQAQYDLIKMLYPVDKKSSDCSLLAVGDIDQSIYSWRGADFKIILNFKEDYKDTKLIKLEQNYRSTTTILEAANEVIKNNVDRIEKNLYSTKGDGEKITFYEALDNYDESRYIARKIEDTSYDRKNIAILYRTNAQSRSIEEALMAYSIPYKVVGGLKFYERKEIKDIVAYLKLIYNHSDSQSLKRIINEPKRSIGDTTVKKLETYADENNISLWEAFKVLDKIDDINAPTKARLQNFYALIDELTSEQNEYALSEFISYLIDKTGYGPALRNDDNIENQSRLENLEEFVNVASEFEQDDFSLDSEDDLGILGNFLTNVALISDIDELDDEKDKFDSVTLMTLHSAKGLEYPLIFLAGLEEGIFPHVKKMGGYNIENKAELEEERRLMYVGITRAKEKLYLTCAQQRKVWGHTQTNPKSRFIDEIPSSLIEDESENNYSPRYSKNYSRDYSKDYSKGYSKESYETTDDAPKSQKSSLLDSIARIKKSAAEAQNKQNEGKIDYKRINARVVKKNKKEDDAPKKSIKELIALAKQKAMPKDNQRPIGLFPVGTRVFHPQFGIGHIKEASYQTYSVEFTKAGLKVLDRLTSDLKTF